MLTFTWIAIFVVSEELSFVVTNRTEKLRRQAERHSLHQLREGYASAQHFCCFLHMVNTQLHFELRFELHFELREGHASAQHLFCCFLHIVNAL
jgi:hypothetical protein